MALIACSKCGRQISTFAQACPACRTPPPISLDPPPLPLPTTTRGKGVDPRVVVAIVIGLVLVAAIIAGNIANKPESRTASAPSWAAPVPAATPQYYPRVPQYYPRMPQQFPRVPQYYPRAIPVAPATPATVTYRVVKISPGDYLNVRAGAGSDYPIIMKLEPGRSGIVLGMKLERGTAGVVLSANRVPNAETMWQEVIVNGQKGWVNADYIAPETQSIASP